MKPVIKKLVSDLFSVEMILYVLFGVGTAAIDIFTAKLLYDSMSGTDMIKSPADVVVANTISFVLSVTFAFFTNKFFVFKSKSRSARHMRIEALKFFIARFLTFGLSLVGLVVLVNVLDVDHDIAKLVVSVVVIILNYIFSKLIIFKNSGDREITSACDLNC